MEKKRKIAQYRERLDRTLASPNLTNEETLQNLVKNQFLRSTGQGSEGYCFLNIIFDSYIQFYDVCLKPLAFLCMQDLMKV